MTQELKEKEEEKPRFALVSFHSGGECVISHCELCPRKRCLQRKSEPTEETLAFHRKSLEKSCEEIRVLVPRQVAELWAQGGSALEEHCGDYQYLFLDALSSMLETLKDETSFAATYDSYEEYRGDLEKTATRLDESGKNNLVIWAREDKKLEDGKKLLDKGITTEKLKDAISIVDKVSRES